MLLSLGLLREVQALFSSWLGSPALYFPVLSDPGEWRHQLCVYACLITAALYTQLGMVSNFLLAGITALFYVVDPLYDVTTSSYSAKIIPDKIRGRVSSLTRLVVLGAYSFGFFIIGMLLQYLGSNLTIGVFSFMLLLLFLATAKNRNLAVTKM